MRKFSRDYVNLITSKVIDKIVNSKVDDETKNWMDKGFDDSEYASEVKKMYPLVMEYLDSDPLFFDHMPGIDNLKNELKKVISGKTKLDEFDYICIKELYRISKMKHEKQDREREKAVTNIIKDWNKVYKNKSKNT